MNSSRFLVLIVLAALLAGAGWYFRDAIFPEDREPDAIPAEPEPEETPARLGPIHPLPPLESGSSSPGSLVPLPELDDSDAYFLLALTDLFGSDIGNMLVDEALIDKFVTTVDNLPRGQVPERIRPIGRLATNFDAVPLSDERFYLGEGNFTRYDIVVSLVTAADLDQVVNVYRNFYPLFQEAYVRLGYPNGYFNDRAVEVIDHLLETPSPFGQIELVRPGVLYEFADPELESLSSGQKLLIRMGGEHADDMKQVLRELRALIAQPGE